MKKSDLYREWARVLDMCEGTRVNPRACWKYGGIVSETHTPAFCEYPLEKYEFAVAILENKPVFVGDKVFDDGIPTVIDLSTKYILFNDKHNCSWNPPNKTFTLNGEELPCLDNSDMYELRIVGFNDNAYQFTDKVDIHKAEAAINKLLQDARK